jgi:hypothetical protein
VENRVDLGGDSGGFRVERGSILYGLLNGDVYTFVVLNFGNKSCISRALCYLLSVAYLYLPFSTILDLGFLMIYYSS